jgi:aryl-alcohol dehydrogenase-like predicted oxidoreductase
MKYRKLGSSDLVVSEIGLGSWMTMSYGGAIPEERGKALIATAFDVGINFIDTANIYSRGRSEEFLGEVLAGRPRDSYVLATKLFWPMSDTDFGLSRSQVFKQIDASLRRLRTDYVDLYQCHRYDWATPLEETMQALTELVHQGKVRYLGFSEWPVSKIGEALAMPGMERFVSSQPQYNVFWRGPERDVIPYCAEHGISQIVWSPLGQGLLTGKYKPGSPPPDDSRLASHEMGKLMHSFLEDPLLLTRIQELWPVAEELQLSVAQLALAWVLRQSNVASAIIGASRPAQLEENAGASGIELDDDTLRRIDEALADSIVYRDPDS